MKLNNLPLLLLITTFVGAISGIFFYRGAKSRLVDTDPSIEMPGTRPFFSQSIVSTPAPKLSVFDFGTNDNGLSIGRIKVVTNRGEFTIQLYTQDAPHSTHRFVDLILQQFYDGLSFHRVVPGFVVQTGDPSHTGRGGSGTKLDPEFNDRPHIQGTVSLARGENPNSADSQFFITLTNQPQLDRKFTVIGQVTDGINTLSLIQKNDLLIRMELL